MALLGRITNALLLLQFQPGRMKHQDQFRTVVTKRYPGRRASLCRLENQKSKHVWTVRNREKMESLFRDNHNFPGQRRSLGSSSAQGRGHALPGVEWGGSCGTAGTAPRQCCAAPVCTRRVKVKQVSAGTCELQEL